MIGKTEARLIPAPNIRQTKPRLSATERLVEHWAVVDPGDRLLDMNCGNGALLECFMRKQECECCGVSSSASGAKAARNRLNADIVYGVPFDIPWRDNAFDVIVWPQGRNENIQPEKALTEVLRVLRPGGQFVLSTRWMPAPILKLAGLMMETRDNSQFHTQTELQSILKDAGFINTSWYTLGVQAGVIIGWKKK